MNSNIDWWEGGFLKGLIIYFLLKVLMILGLGILCGGVFCNLFFGCVIK